MTHLAGEIGSNLKRTEKSYDEELPTPFIENPLPYEDTHNQQLIEEERRLYEENYAARHTQRWQGQERWMGRENEEARLVNILHPHAVFQKLKDAGVNCSVEPAMDWVWDVDHKTGLATPVQRNLSIARFWLHENVILDRVGISAWVWRNGVRTAQYITYMQYPVGPEWSVMRFDEFDVPTSEKYRGWRTALLRLMQEGLLDEREVDLAFGPVTMNEVSELYHEQLDAIRDSRGHI